MHRPLALAVAATLLTPGVAHAGTTYLVDVTVRKSVIVETRCPDGSRRFEEKSHFWRGSGSGELPGDREIILLTHSKLTGDVTVPAEGEPVEEVERKLLSERDRKFQRVASYAAGKVVLDLGRMSPVKRKVRVRAPGTHGRVEIDEPGKEKRKRGDVDADGCTPTTIRVTDVGGSVQRL